MKNLMINTLYYFLKKYTNMEKSIIEIKFILDIQRRKTETTLTQ